MRLGCIKLALRDGAVSIVTVLIVALAPGFAVAQLSGKDGRETVPGGVEQRPGEGNDGPTPRTRGLTKPSPPPVGSSPAPSQAPAPAPASPPPAKPATPEDSATRARSDAATLKTLAGLPGAKPELKALADSAGDAATAAEKAATGYAALMKTGNHATPDAQRLAKEARDQADVAARAARQADSIAK
jgi:hypothetical protein